MSSSSQRIDRRTPIIIGGVGGSGTRVVAQLIESCGVYLGGYQNQAKDNVFFGRMLTSHPSQWQQPYQKSRLKLKTFESLNFGRLVTPGQLACLYRSVRAPKGRNTWLNLRRSYQFRKADDGFQHWGFKNPRSHFFIPQLVRYFPACKYVHVIRHGLDMAFSANKTQLKLWGQNFGVDAHDDTPQAQLRFWIAVNQHVLDQCQSLLPSRHYVINFDRLCASPEHEIGCLIEFLGLHPNQTASALTRLVQTPSSTGRYRGRLDLFSHEEIQAVRDWGFTVDR